MARELHDSSAQPERRRRCRPREQRARPTARGDARRSSEAAARRSSRCAACSACCGRTTAAARAAARTRAAARRWSSASARRAAGRPRGRGRLRGAPPAIDLRYRIVQEALTNVLKHAARREHRVRLRRDAHELRIDVSDDGAGRRGRRPATACRACGSASRCSAASCASGRGRTAASACARLRCPGDVIRVLIADDQELVREGLRMMLEAEGDIEVVGRGRGRERGARSRARARPGRRADGHPDAGARRARGDRAARAPTPHAASSCSPRSTWTSTSTAPAGRRGRLPAQGREPRAARGSVRTVAAGERCSPVAHPAADRGVLPPGARPDTGRAPTS